MRIEYVKDMFVIFKETREVKRYKFIDFITNVALDPEFLETIDYLTQEGQVAAREVTNGVYKRAC